MEFQCQLCGSHECMPLGVLGDLLHVRCRNCGMDSSTNAEAALDQPACVGCEGGSQPECEGRRA